MSNLVILNVVNSFGIEVHPNLFDNEINIINAQNQGKFIEWKLCNVVGNVIDANKNLFIENNYKINTSSLVSGIYFLTIKDVNGEKVFKMVK